MGNPEPAGHLLRGRVNKIDRRNLQRGADEGAVIFPIVRRARRQPERIREDRRQWTFLEALMVTADVALAEAVN